MKKGTTKVMPFCVFNYKGILPIFTLPKSKNIMKFKKSLPVWYGGGVGNTRNARFYSVGYLSRYGLYIS
ncbi:hypothetical protein TM902_380028 [Tenacibaculum maritimum]|nr:hypothetical protein TM902_380028 [Tenacibaculum maritimum]CAA0230656.1 conserved hypothetical protein [Tenacibaculum maritimum]